MHSLFTHTESEVHLQYLRPTVSMLACNPIHVHPGALFACIMDLRLSLQWSNSVLLLVEGALHACLKSCCDLVSCQIHNFILQAALHTPSDSWKLFRKRLSRNCDHHLYKMCISYVTPTSSIQALQQQGIPGGSQQFVCYTLHTSLAATASSAFLISSAYTQPHAFTIQQSLVCGCYIQLRPGDLAEPFVRTKDIGLVCHCHQWLRSADQSDVLRQEQSVLQGRPNTAACHRVIRSLLNLRLRLEARVT